VFKLENIDLPEPWSQLAIDILAQKYFQKLECRSKMSWGSDRGRTAKPQLGGSMIRGKWF